MVRRIADLIVYLIVVFPLIVVEGMINYIPYNWAYEFSKYLFLIAMPAIFVLILIGRFGFATLVQAVYGAVASVLKGEQYSEHVNGGDIVAAVFPMAVIILIIPFSLMYGYQKLVIERRSAQ